MTVNTDQIQSLYNATVIDVDGSKVGGVGQVYLDDQTGQPAWVTAKTGLFGTSETFVPLQDANVDGERIHVPYSKDFIKDAPHIDGDKHLDEADQGNLFNYYSLGDTGSTGDRGTARTTDGRAVDDQGLAAGARNDSGADDLSSRRRDADLAAAGGAGLGTTGPATDSAVGPPAGQPRDLNQGQVPHRGEVPDRSEVPNRDEVPNRGQVPNRDEVPNRGEIPDRNRDGRGDLADDATARAATDGESVVRREERLNVGTERVAAGRLRIRKHVVTDHQTVTVPVEREEVEIVREPITGDAPSAGGALGDDEIEVTLHEDRPVVDKQVVDAERIGVNRTVVAGDQQVSADVQHEEVEVLRDGENDLSAGRHADSTDGTVPPQR